MTELQILTMFYYLSIAIHVVALVVSIAFVLPLQIKEAQVKNGLKRLRIQLLVSGVSFILLNIFSIIALSIPILSDGAVHGHSIKHSILQQRLTVLVVFFHSIGFALVAFIKYAIYHSQYSEKSKNLHSKIEALENRREKV